jgi:hypothetical protein
MELMKLLCGEDFYNKNEELLKELAEIENKYLEFFEMRPPKFRSEKHDRLHNHWILYHDNFKITFGFDPNSDIPEYIKTECQQVFIKIFGTNNENR